jgi:hypothetical protein
MSREEIALWIIVAQGFFVMYFEAGVWWMKYCDWRDKKKWREDKRKALLKKLESEAAAKEADKISSFPQPDSPAFVPKEEPHA